MRGFPRTRTAVVAGCFLIGCEGGPTPEQSLDDAAARVQEARGEYSEVREEVTELRDELGVRRDAVARAEEALAQARDELLDAERRLLQQEDRLAERASDVAVFRSVQKRMLEEACVSDQAISVEVKDRVVTLQGVVDSAEQRACAISSARNEPGVERVVSRIAVDSQS